MRGGIIKKRPRYILLVMADYFGYSTTRSLIIAGTSIISSITMRVARIRARYTGSSYP
jgi:hypothetical protein